MVATSGPAANFLGQMTVYNGVETDAVQLRNTSVSTRQRIQVDEYDSSIGTFISEAANAAGSRTVAGDLVRRSLLILQHYPLTLN